MQAELCVPACLQNGNRARPKKQIWLTKERWKISKLVSLGGFLYHFTKSISNYIINSKVVVGKKRGTLIISPDQVAQGPICNLGLNVSRDGSCFHFHFWCPFAEAAQTELNETISPKGSTLGQGGGEGHPRSTNPTKHSSKVIIAQQHPPYSHTPTWPRTAFVQPWRSTRSPSEQHTGNVKSRTAIPIAVAHGLWSPKFCSGQNAAPWPNPAIPKPASQQLNWPLNGKERVLLAPHFLKRTLTLIVLANSLEFPSLPWRQSILWKWKLILTGSLSWGMFSIIFFK